HRRSRPPLRKKRRAQGSPGATSTSSSADYRGVARQRYALRTRGGCSYNAKIPGNATYPESTAHMGTPGRDEHQLVRGVPGCSAPALRPSHPGRVLLPSYDSRADYRGVAHLRYAIRVLLQGRGCAVTAGG